MKHADIKLNTYFDFNSAKNDKHPIFKVGDHVNM